jgi:hypothetical protein
MEYGRNEKKPEKVKKPYSVKWLGEFGVEVDEFDNLADARLYAEIVSGFIPELLQIRE